MMIERLTRLVLGTMLSALSPFGLAAQEVVVSGEPEPPAPEKRNEVRPNLHASIPYQALSLEYERVMTLDVGAGIMVSAYFGKGRLNILFFPTVGVMPYGRWYFGGPSFSMRKSNVGFFLEANSSIAYNNSLHNMHYEYSPEMEKREKQIEEWHGISWGIGLDGGFGPATHSNWSGEASCRLGRSMVKVSKWNVAYTYPAISTGYRF